MDTKKPLKNADSQDLALARWLTEILAKPSSNESVPSSESYVGLVTRGDYHLQFYQQLPDFCMALLQHDAQATLHYASLLFHLAGCEECRTAYVEIYDALREALSVQHIPYVGQGTRTLAATPHRMIAHLSQTLITQAEAILRQARHSGEDQDATARSLLQLAMRMSTHIMQNSVRREALQDLVRVATLFDGAPAESDAARLTPALAGMNGVRKVYRRTEVVTRNEEEVVFLLLQAKDFDGKLVQRQQDLELQLTDLGPAFHGKQVVVTVPLGSLLEPIRWTKGNPRAIISEQVVSAEGSLTIKLGETDLRLNNPEERNLIEATFLLIEIRPQASL
jgi:hypothetical protein